MAERLTPRLLDLEVRGSSLACRVVSFDKELYSTLSLFIQVYTVNGYRKHTAGCNPAMDPIASHPGGVVILLGARVAQW